MASTTSRGERPRCSAWSRTRAHVHTSVRLSRSSLAAWGEISPCVILEKSFREISLSSGAGPPWADSIASTSTASSLRSRSRAWAASSQSGPGPHIPVPPRRAPASECAVEALRNGCRRDGSGVVMPCTCLQAMDPRRIKAIALIQGQGGPQSGEGRVRHSPASAEGRNHVRAAQ